MFEAKVNEREPIQVSSENGKFLINGHPFEGEAERIGPESFQVRTGGQNHRVHVVRVDLESQTITLKVNGKRANVKLTSEIDKLLLRLGIQAGGASKASNVKAPMPGMIHSVLVAEGQQVSKGEPLMILEAMKMENILKSPADGRIAKVHVHKGMNVDKGALLISFG